MSNQRIYVQRNKLFTPEASAYFLTLAEPKHFDSSDELGSYSLTVTLDPEENGEFIQSIEADAEELYTEYAQELGKPKIGRRPSITPMKDEEDSEGHATGMVHFKLTTKAHRRRNGELVAVSVPVVDTAGKVVPKEVLKRMTRGTKVVASFDLSGYYMAGQFGTSARLRAVQVREPVFRDSDPVDDFSGLNTEGFTVDSDASDMDFA